MASSPTAGDSLFSADVPDQQSRSPKHDAADHDESDTDEHNFSCQDLLEQDLLCPICQDLLINPFLLNCSHSFCKLCVFRWLSSKTECPTCRMTVSFQAENLTLRNVINKLVLKASSKFQRARVKSVQQRLRDEEEQEKSGIPARAKKNCQSAQLSPRATRSGRVYEPDFFAQRTFRELSQSPRPDDDEDDDDEEEDAYDDYDDDDDDDDEVEYVGGNDADYELSDVEDADLFADSDHDEDIERGLRREVQIEDEVHIEDEESDDDWVFNEAEEVEGNESEIERMEVSGGPSDESESEIENENENENESESESESESDSDIDSDSESEEIFSPSESSFCMNGSSNSSDGSSNSSDEGETSEASHGWWTHWSDSSSEESVTF